MIKRSIMVFLVIMILGTLVVGCSSLQEKTIEEQASVEQNKQTSSSQEAEQLYFRTDNGEGGIQVGVTWGTKKYFEATGNQQAISSFDLENQLVFEISMSTHAGDLRTYPILDNAELIIDNKYYKAKDWELVSKDSHHPAGVLTFAAKDEQGESLVKDGSQIELNLKDLGNVQNRFFKWTVDE